MSLYHSRLQDRLTKFNCVGRGEASVNKVNQYEFFLSTVQTERSYVGLINDITKLPNQVNGEPYIIYPTPPLTSCVTLFFLIFINLFIYLFMAALGLHCCAWAFSSCGERGLLFIAVRGLLTAVVSRCRARALGTWASVVVARGL